MTEASDGERCGGIKMLGAGREPEYGTSLPHQYSLMAGQGVPDCADGVAVLGLMEGGLFDVLSHDGDWRTAAG